MRGSMRIVFVLVCCIASCREADDPRDIVTADEVLSAGWGQFESNDYAGALSAFLVASSSYSASAYVGAGWASLRLGQYQDALSYLSRADIEYLSADEINDRSAGLVFLLWGADRDTEALLQASQLNSRSPNYVFQHDETVDFKDIAYVEASIHWGQQNWTNCLNKIRIIDPSYTTSVSDPNIASILLAKLETLGAFHLGKRRFCL